MLSDKSLCQYSLEFEIYSHIFAPSFFPMDFTTVLPEECISLIISLTSPRDACRLSLVCPALRSAADSDAVWESFLPCDYEEIIAASSSASSSLLSMAKKRLYFHLSFHPILIQNGTMSFQLDKETGKKCYMLGARPLSIAWGDAPQYWSWESIPGSRFSEVAELKLVWWLDIRGQIEARILSSRTNYAAYFVYKLNNHSYGFRRTVSLQVSVEGTVAAEEREVLLDPRENVPQQVRERGNGWKEIEMGQFWNESGDDGVVECRLWNINTSFWKEGLIIEGIELRPISVERH